MELKPYFVVSLLVEQPTWGGEYIAQFKHAQAPELQGLKIGQAFELYGESWLTETAPQETLVAFATATNVSNPKLLGTAPGPIIKLPELITSRPAEVLGKRVVAKSGPVMSALIKFTQAKSNSYQAHVKVGAEFGTWLPKPESWFYFEPGLVTLGLAPHTSVEEYQARCEAIDAFAQQVSQKIKAQELTLTDGKQQLKAFIDQDHPRRFVNTLPVSAGQIIDLSAGGIHHSWEVDPQQPLGNIVYEVQQDVRDEYCTLRSFDQGSIKDDGSVRPLSIADYFQAIDTTESFNQPEQFFRTGQTTTDGTATVTSLFDNPFYRTTLVDLSGNYQGAATKLNDSYAHVFVKSGEVVLKTSAGELPLKTGQAGFVPAALDSYSLDVNDQASVIITQG